MTSEPSALSGIKVVDFSRFLPGGYVSWLFGDMGADIVWIEHPRELMKQAVVAGTADDAQDAAAYRRALQTHTRNKRSLLLNPGNPAAREAILKLVEQADVLVEDYRPGTLARMGYSWEELSALNPRLIYVSVSFAGQSGPYADRAGHDPAALALAGALSRLNGTPTPTLPGLQVADVLAGSHATIATLMALQARERTGRGQHVDVAMTDASLPLMMVTMMRTPDPTALPPPDGAWRPKGGVWLCGDGKWICTTDMETRYWRRFCEAVGRPDYADRQHAAEQFPAMHQDLAKIFQTRTRDEWVAVFAAADTQAMPVLDLAEALGDEHNRARGAVVDVPFRDGVVTQVGTPFHLSETPGRVRHPTPAAGADTAAILGELGYDAAGIAKLDAAGAFAS